MDASSNLIAAYLSLPDQFGPLGGLIWSKYGDCLEQDNNQTFIFTKQLADFIEGFASVARVLHFGHMIECWRMLEMETPPEAPQREIFRRLAIAFRQQKVPARNAGVLFAKLTKDVARAQKIHTGGGRAVAQFLALSNELGMLHPKGPGNTERPDRSAEALWQLVASELVKLGDEEIRYAFRHGSPPTTTPSEPIVELIEQKPKTLGDFFDEALQNRERLSPSLPMVRQLVAALSLPPRRQSQQKLPVGGYADVINRGRPERLLLSQFALDSDEFVRRFAENELLYYRKEDPHERDRETLTLVLDQGVRTWGTVRQTLAASLIAFAKVAEKKKLPLKIRLGSLPGEQFEPPTGDASKFGQALEASDLSLLPTLALAEEVVNTDDATRDIVLLTHPATLNEPDILRFPALLPKYHRLFALTVNDEADVELAELKPGGAVSLRRLRIDVPVVEPIDPLATQTNVGQDYIPWTGDVETRPLPFRVGPYHHITHVCLEAEDKYLLMSTTHGFLYLFNIATNEIEMLPRGIGGTQSTKILGMAGMTNAFVVAGHSGLTLHAFHYDLSTRTVTKYDLMELSNSAVNVWSFPAFNCFVCEHGHPIRGLNLNKKELYDLPGNHGEYRADFENTLIHARAGYALIHELQAVHHESEIDEEERATKYILQNQKSGRIVIDRLEQTLTPFIPLSDGTPIYKTAKIIRAIITYKSLAIASSTTQEGKITWHFFNTVDGRLIHEVEQKNTYVRQVAFSSDGTYFAMKTKDTEVTILDLFGGSSKIATPRGYGHTNAHGFLKDNSLIIIIGEEKFELHWIANEVRIERGRLKKEELPLLRESLPPKSPPGGFFVGGWYLIRDMFGQLNLTHTDKLVAIIMVYQKKVCFWMPDGTRYGPAHLTGGPETPDALKRLWKAVYEIYSAHMQANSIWHHA